MDVFWPSVRGGVFSADARNVSAGLLGDSITCACGVVQNDGLLAFFPARRLVRREKLFSVKGDDHEGSDDTTVPGEETAHDAG